jgi:hypothetical protein
MSMQYNVLPWSRENDKADKLAAAKLRDLQDNLRFARQDAEWHRAALERQGKQLTGVHKLYSQANTRIGELLRERLAAAEVAEAVETSLLSRLQASQAELSAAAERIFDLEMRDMGEE